MSIDLESILNQTFNDEYNRMTKKPIGNSEASNINNIFININTITECLICCDDDKICIKCFQCTATYCKVCLIKIASDFNKCSTCGITIKDNYKKLKEYNQELQEQLEIEKAISNSLNSFISSNSTSTKNEVKDNTKDNTNNTNKPIRPNKPNKSNTNINLNLKPSLMNIFKINNKNNKNNENSHTSNSNTDDDDNNNIFNNKKTFIEDLREDKIYNINFTSYINEVSQNKPNYSYELDHYNKILTFYALCNQNNDFINIIVNYNILKSTFQSVLYIWLNEIVKCSINIFKIKWNKIAIKINEAELHPNLINKMSLQNIYAHFSSEKARFAFVHHHWNAKRDAFTAHCKKHSIVISVVLLWPLFCHLHGPPGNIGYLTQRLLRLFDRFYLKITEVDRD